MKKSHLSWSILCICGLILIACSTGNSLSITENETPTISALTDQSQEKNNVITTENADQLEEVKRLGKGNITSINWSPDDTQLAVGTSIGIYFYAVKDFNELHYIDTNSWIACAAFSPDGRTLVSGSNDNTIRLWDVTTGQALRILEGHTETVSSVAFSPDGKTLVSGSYDNTIRVWDVTNGQSLRTLVGHDDWVNSVAFSPDGKTLASGSSDATIRLWDVATGQPLDTLEGHTNWVLSVAFSPDGKTLVSGSRDGTIRLWEIP